MKQRSGAEGAISTLVVDDNDNYRAGLVSYLRTQEGVNVVAEAKGGLEAIQLADVLKVDLVLMDVNMPGIGGLEAARAIKEHRPDLKVVFVTIHEEAAYRRLADLVHADGFIGKSSVKRDFPKILGKIRDELNRR